MPKRVRHDSLRFAGLFNSLLTINNLISIFILEGNITRWVYDRERRQSILTEGGENNESFVLVIGGNAHCHVWVSKARFGSTKREGEYD